MVSLGFQVTLKWFGFERNRRNSKPPGCAPPLRNTQREFGFRYVAAVAVTMLHQSDKGSKWQAQTVTAGWKIAMRCVPFGYLENGTHIFSNPNDDRTHGHKEFPT